MPATRCWSSSAALMGARTPDKRGGQLAPGDRQRVGPERGLVRPQLDAAQPAGVVHRERSAHRRTPTPKRRQAGSIRSGPYSSPAIGIAAVDQQPTGHPEAQTQDRTVGVEHQQLAPPARPP